MIPTTAGKMPVRISVLEEESAPVTADRSGASLCAKTTDENAKTKAKSLRLIAMPATAPQQPEVQAHSDTTKGNQATHEVKAEKEHV